LPFPSALKEPLDLRVADSAPKAYAIDVIERDEYCRLVRDNTEVIKTTGGTENRLFFDPRYDAEPLVGVDDLVADLECHVGSPYLGGLVEQRFLR
jgi:hypothetical protein